MHKTKNYRKYLNKNLNDFISNLLIDKKTFMNF